MATPPPSADDFLNDPRFSRTFSLPADPSNGRARPFTIKYADYGYHNAAHPEQEHVLLFFSPLMGSRLLHICKDDLARKHRIRIINPDRPGIGGTDAAPATDRLALWRDAIPALLAHLQIRHLHAVAAHSGGTVYALDFVLHHPEFLLPCPPSLGTTPTASTAPNPCSTESQDNTTTNNNNTSITTSTTLLALGAPWILPSHTGSLPLSLAQHLPAAAVRQADKLASFVNNHLGPAVGSSIGFAARLMPNRQQAGASGQGEQAREQEQGVADPEARRERDDVQFEERVIWPALMRRVYDEGVAGLSEDALLFLQKVPPPVRNSGAEETGTGAGWGDWGDYDRLVVRLREVLRREGRRLRVRVYYAEKDIVVRDGGAESEGARWFDKCWAEGSSGGDGDADANMLEYWSSTVHGADHDHIWDLRWGVVQEVFGKAGQVSQET